MVPGNQSIVLADNIPFGHKLAVCAVETGADVRKYGEVIGRAVQAIAIGQHVHVHNIEGIRGRGDLGSRRRQHNERNVYGL